MSNKQFYKRILAVALPIMIQNGITNFVQMLDNVMVGQVGTIPMSGVAIVNQLMFVFNLCIFGATSGAGIFTAQFKGREDNEGIRYTFRFKLIVGVLLGALGIGLFLAFGRELIGLYLTGEGSPEDTAATLAYGLKYLKVMLLGLIPFALSNAYSGTLREVGETTVPMVAGIIAVLVNLVGNYILIFGHFGAPAMGVAGAAVATVASRYVEMLIIVLWTHLNPKKNPYVKGLYRSLYIPGKLFRQITVKGMPLLLNEAAYTIGMAFLNQCYSTCGLDVVPALSISTTIYNLTAVVFRSLGNTVGIIMGRMLGAGRPREEVKEHNDKLLAMGVLTGVICGGLTVATSGLFPKLFNTTDEVRALAAGLTVISAVAMPLQAYIFPVYFTLRAGGKTIVTFLFDSGAIWVLMLPIAFCCSRFTGLSILVIYALCNGMDLIKCFVGYYFIRKGDWIQNLTIK